MNEAFQNALSAYRAAAACAFAKFRAGKHGVADAVENDTATEQPSTTAYPPKTGALARLAYQRKLFSALEQFLIQATAKYAAFKSSQVSQSSNTVKTTEQVARALGSSGPLVMSLCADVRRHRWLVYLAEARHRHTMSMHYGIDNATVMKNRLLPPLPCGIPHDVRQRYAKLHAAFKSMFGLKAGNDTPHHHRQHSRPVLVTARKQNQFVFFSRPLGNGDAQQQQKQGQQQHQHQHEHSQLDQTLTPLCLLIHVSRCRASLASGASRLLSQASERTVVHVTAEAVRRKYAGKPDEIYRRKNSKRYAAWKRRVQDMAKASQSRVQSAEHKMRSSRGYDQLLTQRSYGDTSFAPFLFDTESHAFAFSSKISEAPKLRKVMLDKYASSDERNKNYTLETCATSAATTNGSEGSQRQVVVDSLQKAHVAAQTNPLFHTRVMNRFG